MELNEEMKKGVKEHFGFDDEELQLFLDNPRNIEAFSKVMSMSGKTIIVEIIDSHGCNCQHRVGDKFYFDGTGNLLTKLAPKKACIYALSALDKLINATMEFQYAGMDPNKMAFKTAGCWDVGLKCGGVGHIAMELRVEDRKTIK